jgi:hypothetical protein
LHRTLQGMEQSGTIAEWVDGIERVGWDTTNQMLRDHGLVPPPTVHILVEDMTPAYAAYITSREFYPGSDAAVAIAELGVLPSVLMATHLVVTWEYADVYRALETPDGPFLEALAVLEASMSGHTLRWHPFQIHPGPHNRDGALTVLPTWGEPVRYPNAPLPGPIERLLRIWREWRAGDLNQTVISLQQAGYGVRFMER